MIKRAPLKKDASGKCSRWHVVVYNPETKEKDWHTVRGTKDDAKALQTKFDDAKRNGEYNGPLERKTFEEIAKLCVDDRKANSRRVSTIEEYETELNLRLLRQPDSKLPALGPRNIRNIKRADMKSHFNALRNNGCTVSQVNKAIKVAKAFFTYAFDCEYVSSNVMQRYPAMQRVAGERKANRGVFTEEELRSIYAVATPFELSLFGMLGTSGPRPGEVYALEWTEVYLDVEKPYIRIVRTWCSRGFVFYPPKTEAGLRTVPISGWLAAVLHEYRDRCSVGGAPPKGLVFPAELASLDRPPRERETLPVCEQAIALYEGGVNRREIARRLGTTPKKISQLIWYERMARQRMRPAKSPPTDGGLPLNKSNVRQRIWVPLLARAKVRYRDMYSLRWTFVSLARASGENAFNVSRVIGHARSTIVDTVYGHTVDSALAGVSESVADRVGLKLPAPAVPTPPAPPSGPRPLPKLRLMDGGRVTASQNQRDGRKTVENAPAGGPRDGTSD